MSLTTFSKLILFLNHAFSLLAVIVDAAARLPSCPPAHEICALEWQSTWIELPNNGWSALVWSGLLTLFQTQQWWWQGWRRQRTWASNIHSKWWKWFPRPNQRPRARLLHSTITRRYARNQIGVHLYNVPIQGPGASCSGNQIGNSCGWSYNPNGKCYWRERPC